MLQNMLSHARFLGALFLFWFHGLAAQIIDSAWTYTNYSKEDVYIPMRDGVKLFTTVYSPIDKSEFHPMLMMRTPYSVAPYGKNILSPRLYNTYWKKYLEEGYIIVMQDVRGRYMSEGEFEDVRPFNTDKNTKNQIDEASDAFHKKSN